MASKRFVTRQKSKNGPLVGLTLSTFDPVFVEIAARFEIDVIWIELEHSCMTLREAELLCRIISGCGMLSLIRLPSAERDVALKAAETGVDILMAPMINHPSELQELVAHTRYAPQGQRGFYRYSRALGYGISEPISELRRQANDNLMLWGQIETLSALDRLSELCQVDGIDGLFMGPGDLSSAYGVPGQVTHERVVDAVRKGLASCQEHRKFSGTVCRPTDSATWIDQGIDLLFVGGNIEFYVKAAETLRRQLDESASPPSAARGGARLAGVERIDLGHPTPSLPTVARPLGADHLPTEL